MILEFEFEGYVSLNQIYSSPHWSVRSRIKREWRQLLLDAILRDRGCTLPELIEEFKSIKVKEVHVKLSVNNRLDLDNSVMMNKFLMDMLQQPTKKTKDSDIKLCLIPNDGPNVFTKLQMEVDRSLPKSTGRFELTIIEENPTLDL